MIRADLDLNFIKNPLTGDLNIKRNDEAIKQSLRTLLLTALYEKPFNNELGGNLREFLFSNYATGLRDKIKERIAIIIKKYEPGIEIKKLIINDDDSIDRETGFMITLEYVYSGNISNQLSITLGRNR